MSMIINLLIAFLILAVLGWIIETIYRSIVIKKLINPGFLNGPYLPIYGFGGLILYIITSVSENLGLFWTITLFIVSTTILELITGLIFESIFKIRLWDYSKNFLNYKGLICVEFSMYWTILALLFKEYMHPIINSILNQILSNIIIFSIGFIYGIIFLDIIISFEVAYKARNIAIRLKNKLKEQKLNFEILYSDITKKLNEDIIKRYDNLPAFSKFIESIKNHFRLDIRINTIVNDVISTKIKPNLEKINKLKNNLRRQKINYNKE